MSCSTAISSSCKTKFSLTSKPMPTSAFLCKPLPQRKMTMLTAMEKMTRKERNEKENEEEKKSQKIFLGESKVGKICGD